MIEGKALEEVRSFLKSRVILTAADLDLFTRLDREHATAKGLAQELDCDKRALTRLLDCLVASNFLSRKTAPTGPLTEALYSRPDILRQSCRWCFT